MKTGTTLFELIAKGDIPSHEVYSSEHVFAFLDIHPRADGHTLVIPRRGVKYLAELNLHELSELIQGVVAVQGRLSRVFGGDDYTVVVHDGPAAGQEIPHVHVHVIPRFEGDGGTSLLSMFPSAPPFDSSESHPDKLSNLSNKLRSC